MIGHCEADNKTVARAVHVEAFAFSVKVKGVVRVRGDKVKYQLDLLACLVGILCVLIKLFHSAVIYLIAPFAAPRQENCDYYNGDNNHGGGKHNPRILRPELFKNHTYSPKIKVLREMP